MSPWREATGVKGGGVESRRGSVSKKGSCGNEGGRGKQGGNSGTGREREGQIEERGMVG